MSDPDPAAKESLVRLALDAAGIKYARTTMDSLLGSRNYVTLSFDDLHRFIEVIKSTSKETPVPPPAPLGPLRGTGRTTRLLNHAIDLAFDGKCVLFVSATENEARAHRYLAASFIEARRPLYMHSLNASQAVWVQATGSRTMGRIRFCSTEDKVRVDNYDAVVYDHAVEGVRP